jgi:hypothetical protein
MDAEEGTMTDLTPEERRRIYDEEKASIESDATRTGGQAFNYRRIAVWTAGLLVALVGISLFAFHEYRVHDINQKLGDAIGKDQGLTETILKIETESSKITFGEVFELCNRSIESRTNLIVDLRGVHPEMAYGLKTRLIDYLSAENEFVRTKRDFYRKLMEESTTVQLYTAQLNNPPSSVYGWEFFNNQARQLKAKLVEAANAASKSADDFSAQYAKLTIEEAEVSRQAQSAGLRFELIFRQCAADNQKKVKEAKDGVVQLASVLSTQKF